MNNSKSTVNSPADLNPFWMPFTANRQFKSGPRMMASASGMYYQSDDGRQILDGTAGLWCCNAGHARQPIIDAVSRQIASLDFAPTFQMGHHLPFVFAERLAQLAPGDLNNVFFTNSGSESVDTALKIALAYHYIRGETGRTRLIGREKAYHGVGFGGIAVGGLPNTLKGFGSPLPGVDHLPHTLDIERNGFSRGLPKYGIEKAEALETLCKLHGADKIAAVIVEPISGSAGVILPPPGYLQRLREICTRHGILLIFDEVITGFGRVGDAFAATHFGVQPDLIVTAKGLTNGSIPMGAVLVSDQVREAFDQGPENAIDLYHGYTYSGHPVAAAAGLATLDIYLNEQLFEKAEQLHDYWQEAAHSLKGTEHVIDIRNYGLIAGIELRAREGAVGSRGYDVFNNCFREQGLLVRCTGDTIALSPPLILEKSHIDQIFESLRLAIKSVR